MVYDLYVLRNEAISKKISPNFYFNNIVAIFSIYLNYFVESTYLANILSFVIQKLTQRSWELLLIDCDYWQSA